MAGAVTQSIHPPPARAGTALDELVALAADAGWHSPRVANERGGQLLTAAARL
jgi:hypothetical protein